MNQFQNWILPFTNFFTRNATDWKSLGIVVNAVIVLEVVLIEDVLVANIRVSEVNQQVNLISRLQVQCPWLTDGWRGDKEE